MTTGKRSRRPGYLARWQRSLIVTILVLVWSVGIAWGMAYAAQPKVPLTDLTLVQLVPTTPTINSPLDPLPSPSPSPRATTPVINSPPTLPGVDPVPQRYQLGQELYLGTCAACHLAIPPEVFPSSTWRELLLQPEHFGVRLDLPIDPPRFLIWNYLQNFSRSLLPDEPSPIRLDKSRYFKALHPDVEVPRPVRLDSCIACHPKAPEFNFRSLSREWTEP